MERKKVPEITLYMGQIKKSIKDADMGENRVAAPGATLYVGVKKMKSQKRLVILGGKEIISKHQRKKDKMSQEQASIGGK